MDETRTERRDVRSGDPSLTPEANRLLTEELRAAAGTDQVEVPADTPTRSVEAHGRHSAARAALDAARPGLVIGFFALMTIGVIISLATHTWWALGAALVVHAIGTLCVAAGALQLTTQTEHLSPGTQMRLEEEGVSDPDRVFNDLMEDVAGARRRGPTREALTPGDNVRTAPTEVDPALAAAEQRTANTPSAGPIAPSGGGAVIGGLPWWVVVGVMLAALVGAIVVGGAVWIAPAVIWPLGLAWMTLQRRMGDDPPDGRARP